jgi:hypothetical protein
MRDSFAVAPVAEDTTAKLPASEQFRDAIYRIGSEDGSADPGRRDRPVDSVEYRRTKRYPLATALSRR